MDKLTDLSMSMSQMSCSTLNSSTISQDSSSTFTLKPLHERAKNNGMTDFGLEIKPNEMAKYFSNNPEDSKLYFDYDLFEPYKHDTNYINNNCVKL